MSVRYLLDTNTAGYVIKGNTPRLREKLLRVSMAEVGISVLTEAELRYGVARIPEVVRLATAVEEFLLRVEILPWNSEAAKQYSILRAGSEREARPMGNLDLMIAAQALAVGAVLVTHDQGFRGIGSLRTVDWTQK